MKLTLHNPFKKQADVAAAAPQAAALRWHWPWQRQVAVGQVAIASSANHFIYVQADASGRLLRCGQLARGGDTPAAFTKLIHGLGLPRQQVSAVLPLNQAQLIQVEAPTVKPEELRSAARWRIKDQVEGRLDEYIIDVMFVGDDKPRPHRQLFVAAARSAAIRELSERCLAAGLEVTVIDLAETAQRNLHTAQARREGLAERATATLMQHGDQCLLTWDFLFHLRRFNSELQTVRGASHLKFDASGLIEVHRDYWDVAEELYEKLPGIGSLMRWLKRRANS